MASTTSPNTSATPTWVMVPPLVTFTTIAPVPAKTSANVPRNSAAAVFIVSLTAASCLQRFSGSYLETCDVIGRAASLRQVFDDFFVERIVPICHGFDILLFRIKPDLRQAGITRHAFG